MKKLLISLLMLAVCGMAVAAETNYWPNNTNMNPKNVGATYGQNAYVVGVDKAAVNGSIAIGSATGVAYVKDATNAVQIGAGANTTANTVKVMDKTVYPPQATALVGKVPAANLSGLTTNFTFLSATATTGRLWMAGGVITNVTLSAE